MSSILEALKKLEDDKAARRGGIGNIAGRVTSKTRRVRMLPQWFWAAAMATVTLCAVVVTFALMGGFNGSSAPPPVGAQATPAKEVVAPPTDATAATPTAAPSLPSTSHVVTTAKQQSHQPAAPTPQQVLPQPAQHNAAPVVPEGKGAPAQAPVARPVPAQPLLPAMPALTVTGIAWQTDQAARLAIINGSPVSEGSQVAGALVEEIFPDRVRLSFHGKLVDISMDKK